MLYICIPVYNEAPTIGVLLWKIRAVFQAQPRDYELIVYDDASTDATVETLEPYAEVLPLTLIRGTTRLGYAGAIDKLLRTAAQRTRYPRRDACVLMQGDFTDRPESIPDLVKRFEGGADVVVAERPKTIDLASPTAQRRLERFAPWVLRPFVRVPGVRDPFGSLRLLRISVVRDLVKQAGTTPIVSSAGWAANVELLMRASAHARRVETIELAPRYDLRPRPSRIRPIAHAMDLMRFARGARRSIPVAAER